MGKLKRAVRIGIDRVHYRSVRTYVPASLETPSRLMDAKSAWKGNEQVIRDILDRFGVGRNRCLEFGVEFGYSAVALSNYFDSVTGVDTFEGDVHSFVKPDHFEETADNLKPYPNICLAKSDYRDWIETDRSTYDLVHVDIVHTYKDTYQCGLWSAQHSHCTIFHDTESFRDVKNAVLAISKKTRKAFYNYPFAFGLGILV